jgi:hypothetical protein
MMAAGRPPSRTAGAPPHFHRVAAESLTMHETIPGHYLQWAMLAQQAAEFGLYSTPFDEMGGFVNSVTPSAAADLASSPASGVETYPIDALQYESARKRAQDALGSQFDSRAYHQMILSEGALPISALTAEVDRWIAAQH